MIATPAEIEVSEGAGTIDITFSLVDCPIPSEFDIWTLYFLPGTVVPSFDCLPGVYPEGPPECHASVSADPYDVFIGPYGDWEPGNPASRVVPVQIVDDSEIEADEVFEMGYHSTVSSTFLNCPDERHIDPYNAASIHPELHKCR